MRAVLLASLVGSALSTCTPPTITGEQRLFVVEQENGKNRRTVPAIEGKVPAAQFYDYYDSCSHTGYEVAHGSVMMLYRNVLDTSNNFDVVITHGKTTHIQGGAHVDALLTGIPTGVTIAQRDDSSAEVDWTTSTVPGVITGTGPNIGGYWTMSEHSDGVALEGFPATEDWTLKVDEAFRGDMQTWTFVFGDGTTQDLDVSEPVYLKPLVTPVTGFIPAYPETDETQTYCSLADEAGGTTPLEYTFSWGDGTADTVVTQDAGKTACATHTFCQACGGAQPRQVVVSVKSTDAACAGEPAVSKVLADEGLVCYMDALGVKVDGTPVEGGPAVDGGRLSLTRIPSQFSGMSLFVPATDIQVGGELELKCCGAGDCAFVVSTYHCPPCSATKNGGYPATLPTDGFTAGSCAPHFGADADRMTSFYITVPGDSSVTLPAATVAAPYVAVFGQKGHLDAWCPTTGKNNCGGPCPPTTCVCNK